MMTQANAANTNHYDAIIVGSGFGGAVTAARLAEAGWKVLVLERGRRWESKDMPRGHGDAWLYDIDEPHKQNGWLDFRYFGNMSVAMGAGVGGGSLIYGNVSIIPPRETFAKHWPAAISFDALLPHYETVGRVLNVQEMPLNQVPKRFAAMQKGALAIGAGQQFRRVPLAVSFNADWERKEPECYDDKASDKFINAQGREQGTCNHCGFCCSGCKLKAKNTLDLNYLAIAEDKGARILPLHLVDSIEKLDTGYRVHAENVAHDKRHGVHFTAKRVILSAGSLGSTEILLRSRDEKKFLPNISGALGEGWSSNGDFLTFSTHREDMIPTRSPTISCAINFLEGKGYDGEKIFVEDGALGDIPTAYMSKSLLSVKKWLQGGLGSALINRLVAKLRGHNTGKHTIAWFAQSVDASNGRLILKKSWLHGGRKRLHLNWDIKLSERNFMKVNELHKKLAAANDPVSTITLPTWTLLRDLTTPHPLGGCRMADNDKEGVVDHRGEVYGYPGLYVADGAIIPYALGINPSRTIAALAERNVGIMLDEANRA